MTNCSNQKLELESAYNLATVKHLTWDQLHTVLQNFECAYSDYQGFHLGKVPEQLPLSTHLWAWLPNNDNIRFKVRIEQNDIFVNILYTNNICLANLGNLAISQEQIKQNVPIRRAAMLSWRKNDLRVKAPQTEAILGKDIEMIEVLLPAPIAFYKVA